MRGILAELCRLLDRSLNPGRRFMPDYDDPKNALRLAVVVLAMNALDAAHAVYDLSGKSHAATCMLHYRAIFEALVKIRWMRKRPKRAKRFFMSAPFERYLLATDRVKKSHAWAQITKECLDHIARNPALLRLRKVRAGKNNPPNMKPIRNALRGPHLKRMATEIGMDEEELLLDHGVPSLGPHSSVIVVEMFGKRKNPDGTVTLSTEMDPNMLLGYVARSATRTGEVLNEVLDLYPDGKIMFDSEKVAKQLGDITKMLRDSIWLNVPTR